MYICTIASKQNCISNKEPGIRSRVAYPDVIGVSSRNLWYMKQWYIFYCSDSVQTEKLHQLGAEMVSPNRIASIIDNGEMLPVFGIVPWKHHILIASKSSSIEEANGRLAGQATAQRLHH